MRRFFFLFTALIAAICCAKVPDTKADALSSVPTQVSPPAPTEIPILRFQGPVNDESSQMFTDAMAALAMSAPPVLVLELNTGGGSPQAGFLMVKAIESFPAQVVCVVDGEADSEGFYILQACDVRLMTFRSTIMVHEPYFMMQNAILTRDELRNLAGAQAAMAESWTSFACRRLDMKITDCQTLIRHNDWFMAAPEALAKKAIDKIVPSTQAVVKSLYIQLVLMPRLMQELQAVDGGATGPAAAPAQEPADAGVQP